MFPQFGIIMKQCSGRKIKGRTLLWVGIVKPHTSVLNPSRLHSDKAGWECTLSSPKHKPAPENLGAKTRSALTFAHYLHCSFLPLENMEFHLKNKSLQAETPSISIQGRQTAAPVSTPWTSYGLPMANLLAGWHQLPQWGGSYFVSPCPSSLSFLPTSLQTCGLFSIAWLELYLFSCCHFFSPSIGLCPKPI